MSNGTDLSYIKTIEDLRAMQVMVKLRIKEREKDLGDRLHKVPQEAIKATVGAVLPVFINNKITGTTFSLVKALFGIFKKHKAGEKREGIFSSAKQLGLFTLLRAGFKLWKGK